MKFYFGGAYNGKLKLVKETFQMNDEAIFFCHNHELDFSKSVICGIDRLIYFNALHQKASLPYFKDNLEQLKDKIIICDDMSSGIVPLKQEERFFREEAGRVMQFLSQHSETVVRVFCGIPSVLKDE